MRLSVDTFKITLAFKNPFPFMEDDLNEGLERRGFKRPKDGATVLRISQDGRQGSAFRWVREETEVYYEPVRPFLSAEGLSFSTVAAAFGELHALARELLEGAFESQKEWAEINALVRGLGSQAPLIALKEYANESLYGAIGRMVGRPVQPFSISVYSSEEPELNRPLNEIPDWIHFGIQPLVLNPQYYVIRLVFRQQDVKRVEEFAQNLEKALLGFLGEIEA